MKIHHFFIPHKDTHQKAHLITWPAIAVYLLLFIILQASFSIIGFSHPGVLGTTSSISAQRVIELTNQERAKLGLPPLTQNSELTTAAANKARNMFEENYWAHFAPSGKSPWDFITAAGYKFTFAGENLAKSFSSADDVVTAWMNSPSHRANIVNSRFKDIGIAVEDGVLEGKQTTLVVQEFGTSTDFVATVPKAAPEPTALAEVPSLTSPTISPTVAPTSSPIPEPTIGANVGGESVKAVPLTSTNLPKPLFDPFIASKVVGISLVTMIGILLLADFYILKKRGVVRTSSFHLAHLGLILVALVALITAKSGGII